METGEKIGRLEERIQAMDLRLTQRLTQIEEKVGEDYVSRHEFVPVRSLVYGLAGLLLAGIVAALIKIALGGPF